MRNAPSPTITAPTRRSWALLLLSFAFVMALALLLGPCQNAASQGRPPDRAAPSRSAGPEAAK